LTRLEWWHGVEPGFVAHSVLLEETFATRIATYDATVHPPSISAPGIPNAGGLLTPPRIGERPAATPEDYWGEIHQFGADKVPVGVIVRQLAFTAELADEVDLSEAVVSIVGAMDEWWENVRAWLEVTTGQHLTQVGHQDVEVIGNKTPIWPLKDDGTYGKKFNFDVTIAGAMPRRVRGVSADLLRECVLRSSDGPPLAWTLLRDASSLHHVGQYRRAVIDAATAAELGVTKMLDIRLNDVEEQVRAALLKAHTMLGRKKALLAALGLPAANALTGRLGK